MTETSSNNSLDSHSKDNQKKHNSGWISLHRSIQEHWLWRDDKKLKWWITMLLEVNHTDNKFVLGYEIFKVKRGQSSNSLRTWAKLFNATPKTVSKYFDLLKNDNMITVKILGKGKQSTTLINIENYNEFQDVSKRKVTHEVTHEVPTNNNVNNLKKNNSDRLSITLKFVFNKPDLMNIDSSGSLFELLNNSRVINYVKKSLTKKEIAFELVRNLIRVFFIRVLLSSDEYKSLGDILKHCIHYINKNLAISEATSKTNYQLTENKIFWEAYNTL